MPRRRRPPFEFWIWLAVIGLLVVTAVMSLTLSERIAGPKRSLTMQQVN
jgi:hypothetical protein